MGWVCGAIRGVGVLPLLGGFSCKVYLQCLTKILLQEACFLLLPSRHHLGIHPFTVFFFLEYFRSTFNFQMLAPLKLFLNENHRFEIGF
jgi:hypothetical protein